MSEHNNHWQTVYMNKVFYVDGEFYDKEADAVRACKANYLSMAVRVYSTPKGVKAGRLNQRLAKDNDLDHTLRGCTQLTSIQKRR